MKPICLDLCCGLGGWAEGFLAAGYDVTGYDVEPRSGYPGHPILQDVRDVESIAISWRGRVDVIVASPPCQEFSIRDMPWGRKRNLPPPDMSIVEACLALRGLIRPRVFLMENVRGLQRWLSRAPLHRGPFYLWGDVALVPPLEHYVKGAMHTDRKSKGSCAWKESLCGRDPLKRAKIPFQLAFGFAEMCRISYSEKDSDFSQVGAGAW